MNTGSSIVESYLAGMRRGPKAEDDMVALFTDDAMYDEPFTGLGPAVGRAAIRERLRLGWQTPLPDMELEVLSIEVTGDRAIANWECRSSALNGPSRGTDEYAFRDGRISSLRVTINHSGAAGSPSSTP